MIYCNCGVDSQVASNEISVCTGTFSFPMFKSLLFEAMEMLISLVPYETKVFFVVLFLFFVFEEKVLDWKPIPYILQAPACDPGAHLKVQSQ